MRFLFSPYKQAKLLGAGAVCCVHLEEIATSNYYECISITVQALQVLHCWIASPRLYLKMSALVNFSTQWQSRDPVVLRCSPGNSTQSWKKRCIRFLRVVTLRSHRIAIVTCLHTCTGPANRLCKSHAMCKSAKSCAKGKVQITSFALAVQKSPACGCIVTAALLHHAPLPHTHMGPMDVVMAPKPPQ